MTITIINDSLYNRTINRKQGQLSELLHSYHALLVFLLAEITSALFILIQLDAPLWTMMRSPPPCVTTTTSIGHVIDLMLEKRHRMIIVVNSNDLDEAVNSFRAIGIFTSEQLCAAIKSQSKM